MKVRVVRLAEPGCEPDCPEWISAIGRIDATTPGEFRKVLTKLGDRKLPVLIDSGGGTVDAGYSVGRMIRAKGLDVVVSKTEFTACALAAPDCSKLRARGVALGRPVAKISKCASSCAFVLAGGVRRYVGPWTFVGLHELKSISYLVQRQYLVERRIQYGVPVEVRRTLVKEQTTAKKEGPTGEKVYDKVRSYFVEMGISEDVMPLLRSAPHTSIRLLKAAELKAVGLATDFINGEQLLLPQNEPQKEQKEAPRPVLPPITSAGVPVAPGNGLPGSGAANCSRAPGIMMPCGGAGSAPPTPPPAAWPAAPAQPLEAPATAAVASAVAAAPAAPVVTMTAPAPPPPLALAPPVPMLVAPASPQPVRVAPAPALAPALASAKEAPAVVEAEAEPAASAESPPEAAPAPKAVPVVKAKAKPAAKPRPQQAERFDPFRSN